MTTMRATPALRTWITHHHAFGSFLSWAQHGVPQERDRCRRIAMRIVEGHDAHLHTEHCEPIGLCFLTDNAPSILTRAAIPADTRRAVYQRDGHRCLRCGATDRLSLDHVIPWSQGGADDIDNLRTLCSPCNSSRGAGRWEP